MTQAMIDARKNLLHHGGRGRGEQLRAGSRKVAAKSVILISHNTPARDLFNELRGRYAYPDLQIVGDTNSPRFLDVAIREGSLAGRAV
jgi:hypothetical protein